MQHKTTEKQFNCDQCDFQATAQLQLNKHINLKHKTTGQNKEQAIQCRNCDEQFSDKRNLMNHRKRTHINTVAYCRNYQEGICNFTAELCWWNHDSTENNKAKNSNIITCYICNSNFESKSEMMFHRKTDHKNVVRKCNRYLQNNCRFESIACWYLHDEEDMEVDDNFENIDTGKGDKEKEPELVFQKARGNLKPPIEKQKID